jgi:hypothetical protein
MDSFKSGGARLGWMAEFRGRAPGPNRQIEWPYEVYKDCEIHAWLSVGTPLSPSYMPKELVHRKHNGRPGIFSGGAWMTRGPIPSHYSEEPMPWREDHHPITPTHGRDIGASMSSCHQGYACCMKSIVIHYNVFYHSPTKSSYKSNYNINTKRSITLERG